VINRNGRQPVSYNSNDKNDDNKDDDDDDDDDDNDDNDNNDDNDDDNDNNIDEKKSGQKDNNWVSGEIIPILFSIAKFNCSTCKFNPAVALLDLGFFKFVKHELCRPYVVLLLIDNDDDDNNDDDNDNNDDND
jgi:hypothetical protein